MVYTSRRTEENFIFLIPRLKFTFIQIDLANNETPERLNKKIENTILIIINSD